MWKRKQRPEKKKRKVYRGNKKEKSIEFISEKNGD